MYPNLFRLIMDAGFWIVCIVALGFMSKAGVIENPEMALAGAAFWWAIRAHSRAEVNTAHKSETEA